MISFLRYSRYCCKPPAISLFKSRILSFISSSTLVWNLSFFKALSYSDYHNIKLVEFIVKSLKNLYTSGVKE